MAELNKVITERGSIRSYIAAPVTDEELKALLDAGLKAPTARNEQELHFTALHTDNAVAAELQKALNPNASGTFYYGAPLLFVISGRDDFSWSAVDAGIAVENMHLAARDLGLGSVIIGCIKGIMIGERKAEFNEKLGIPEGFTYQIALAVGHTDAVKEPHTFDFERQVNIL